MILVIVFIAGIVLGIGIGYYLGEEDTWKKK